MLVNFKYFFIWIDIFFHDNVLRSICYNCIRGGHNFSNSKRLSRLNIGANSLYDHRVHTEWQLPLSSVHSIMMEKLSQPGEGGGCSPPPFTISTITYKVVVYAPAERADILFQLYPYMYSVFTTLPRHFSISLIILVYLIVKIFFIFPPANYRGLEHLHYVSIFDLFF
jgi:hypothetical protein